jgi:polyisoprenoid-binding protein YceI
MFAVAIFGIALIAAVNMVATPWTIDKSHSSIKFEIRHFFSNVPGAFHEYDANVNFNPENLGESSIDVTIQVASVDTENERRDNHLRNEDFFEADTWPTMTFTSSEIVSNGDNNFVAKGQLTIKDTTVDFDLPFTLLGVMDHPWQENTQVAGIVSEFQLLRNDFGVGTGNYVSDAVIGNEVNITLNLELNATTAGS